MYFAIRKNNAGQFWWRAYGDNNEIMASSELMLSQQSCESAVATVKREAATANVHDDTAIPKEHPHK